jgi:hypothetical protein
MEMGLLSLLVENCIEESLRKERSMGKELMCILMVKDLMENFIMSK